MSELLPMLPILVPMASAILLLALWRYPSIQRPLHALFAAVLFIVSVLLFLDVEQNGIRTVVVGGWRAPFGITFVADLFSSIVVVISGVLALSVAVTFLRKPAAGERVDSDRSPFFWPLLNTLLMGVNGAFLTGDLFNMYVWFEVLLISSFVLTVLGGRRSQFEGSIKYVTLNLMSSILFLVALGILYGTVGTLNMADLAVQLPLVQNSALVLALASLFFVAFGIKSAIFPLYFWLPASYHTLSAPLGALFAGLLTKVGVYALFRVFTLVFAPAMTHLQGLILVVAAFTMVVGVFGAVIQYEVRRILSFHIISQIGYFIFALGIFTPIGLAAGVYYFVHHIIAKSNLFLVAGAMERVTGSTDLRRMGGLYREHPWLAILFLIPAMALAGFPPLSGFWAKFSVIYAGFESKLWVVGGVALFVGLLTIFSMMKIWSEGFWKNRPVEDTPFKDVASTGRLDVWTLAPIAFLAALSVLMGLFAGPVFDVMVRAGEQLMHPAAYINAVLGGSR